MNTLAPKADARSSTDIEAKMLLEVRGIGIPPRPAILDQINREMAKDEPDFKFLADVVSSDVGLSASLIKVANSPYFGFGKKVRSVREALLVLGLKIIVRTIAGLALQKTFPHIPSLERFWDSSACTARVSGWLAQQLKGATRVRPDDAYTFGLFRDCGVPVLMIPFPEYQGVLRQANDERELAFTAIEDQMLSINHAIVGSELAEEWLLPEEIYHAIRHHHDAAVLAGSGAATAPESSRRLIAVSQAAEYLIQRHTGRNQTNEWHKLGETCLSLLGLGQEDLDRLCDGCHAAVSGDAA
ncbi:MAG: HDOD domain-containing protein [Rhodocyclales bacterium]|nr:HDOD domain-containing protein [Rhodocyclales bacterium]